VPQGSNWKHQAQDGSRVLIQTTRRWTKTSRSHSSLFTHGAATTRGHSLPSATGAHYLSPSGSKDGRSSTCSDLRLSWFLCYFRMTYSNRHSHFLLQPLQPTMDIIRLSYSKLNNVWSNRLTCDGDLCMSYQVKSRNCTTYRPKHCYGVFYDESHWQAISF
jgi:hypothetical protein